jgi:hypothetical protein
VIAALPRMRLLADATSKMLAPEVPVNNGLSTQAVILDSVVFVLGVVILGGLLFVIGRRIFSDDR